MREQEFECWEKATDEDNYQDQRGVFKYVRKAAFKDEGEGEKYELKDFKNVCEAACNVRREQSNRDGVKRTERNRALSLRAKGVDGKVKGGGKGGGDESLEYDDTDDELEIM
jgi:hypothetical protein